MTNTESNITDYMRGFVRGFNEHKQHLIKYPLWQQAAEQELAKRSLRFLASLGDDDLAAIASGEVNVNELAKKLA